MGLMFPDDILSTNYVIFSVVINFLCMLVCITIWCYFGLTKKFCCGVSYIRPCKICTSRSLTKNELQLSKTATTSKSVTLMTTEMNSASSTDIVICVASHIYYDGQLELLNVCIDSLISQTKHADKLISISFSDMKYKKLFTKKTLMKYGRRKEIKFKFSKQRQSQMQHIANLMKFIKGYNLIMFCDDDDTYHKDRVLKFSECHKKGIAECAKKGSKFAGVREMTNSSNSVPEIWGHGLVPQIMEMFFHRMRGNMDLLSHNLADMYFRMYLGRLNKSYMWLEFDSDIQYYKYNAKNPDSICAKIEEKSKL
eukprot:72769_1